MAHHNLPQQADNLARLARMSPGELQALQAEAMALFSPDALAVLRARGQPPPPPPSTQEQQGQGDGGGEEERGRRRAELLSRDLRTEAALERAVAELLGEEERAKLAWTVPVAASQQEQGSGLVRVDLEGRVLSSQNRSFPSSSSPPRHSGLYHNPEQEAGYTLPHLCATARSSHTRQRALALRILALALRNPALGPALRLRGERLPVALPLVVVAGARADRHRAARAGGAAALAALAVDVGEERAKDEVMDLSVGQAALPPSQGAFVQWGGGAWQGEEEEGEEEGEHEAGEKPCSSSDPFAQEEERALDAVAAAEERRLLRERRGGGPPVEGQGQGEEEEEAPAAIGTACARAFARDAPRALHRWGVLRLLAQRATAAMLAAGAKEGEADVCVELLPALALLGWAAHRGQALARCVAFGYDEVRETQGAERSELLGGRGIFLLPDNDGPTCCRCDYPHPHSASSTPARGRSWQWPLPPSRKTRQPRPSLRCGGCLRDRAPRAWHWAPAGCCGRPRGCWGWRRRLRPQQETATTSGATTHTSMSMESAARERERSGCSWRRCGCGGWR